MSRIVSVTGIVLVMIGTIFSLWSILGTKGNYVGTAKELDERQKNFKEDKKRVIAGTILIITGSILQIVAMF